MFSRFAISLLFFALACLPAPSAWSGSNFALPQTSWVGENFDWHVGHGQVLINKRDIKKKSLKMFETDQSIDWVSRYGSITFNQIALDHPMSGMNEAGLVVVASENFGEGNAKAQNGFTINEYQWVQYQLDNFATVKEVIAHVNELGISSLLEELHYFVCDATTACAAFEVSIAKNEFKIYSGPDFSPQVLTDSGYSDCLKKFLLYKAEGSPKFQLDPFDSNDRFLFLANKLSAVALLGRGSASLDNILNILALVKQPGFTQWQIAFDAGIRKIAYKTEAAPGTGFLDLATFDFTAGTGPLSVDIQDYASSANKNPKAFVAMTHDKNVDLVNGSMSYLGSVLPAGGELKLKSYPNVLVDVLVRRLGGT